MPRRDKPIADKPRPDKPSNRTPTSDDVAFLAGVSRSAVSRTFTEGASVAPATREKVMEAARALGYRVNFLARSLSQKRTDLVAVVVSDIDNPFRAALLDQIARNLIRQRYRPFVLPTTPGKDAADLIDMMLHYNVSGAIVTGDASPGEIAIECAAYNVPLVLINKPVTGPEAANISMDMAHAGVLAAEALHKAGCRRIAIAAQRRPSYSITTRRASFSARAEALGLEVVGEFAGALPDYAGGTEAAAAFLESRPAIDGIYCVNDYLALGLMDHLRHKAGIRIPEDLKIVACDDIAEAAWLSYDLTTVRQDPALLAQAAVDAVAARIATPPINQTPTIIRVALVERGSTRPTAASQDRTT